MNVGCRVRLALTGSDEVVGDFISLELLASSA